MGKMIQTPSGDYVHPQDFVRRRRWAPIAAPDGRRRSTHG
jgi:hypothetical protein